MSPIFIVGAARSGTTLLQFMLRAHPDIYMPTAESHFIIPFNNRIEMYGDLSHRDNVRKLLLDIYKARKTFFDDDMNSITFNADEFADAFVRDNRQSFPDIVSGLFEVNARAEGKSIWGDKTPYYILHLPVIMKLFPDARIVHLIRDGRDCCLSMLRRKHDLKIFNTYHAAVLWDKYTNAGQSFGKDNHHIYHEIRYEDILDDPVGTMKPLYRFLEVDYFNPSRYLSKTRGAHVSDHVSRNKTPLVGRPIEKTNQQKWRNIMTDHQVRLFESVAGDTLKMNGYDLVYDSPALSPAVQRLYEIHIRLNHMWHRFRDRTHNNR